MPCGSILPLRLTYAWFDEAPKPTVSQLVRRLLTNVLIFNKCVISEVYRIQFNYRRRYQRPLEHGVRPWLGKYRGKTAVKKCVKIENRAGRGAPTKPERHASGTAWP